MKKVFIVILCVFAVAAGIILRPAFYYTQSDNTSYIKKVIHYSAQSNKQLYTGLKNFENTAPIQEKVYAAIVSHHFLTEREIADLFSRLRAQKPSLVVVVGPNHFNAGNAPVLVSKGDYDTPWGVLENNTAFTEKLIKSGLAQTEEQPFEIEHSISTLTGFVKYTFPKTKIVPIIIKRGSGFKEAENLGLWLAKNLPEDALVLISADFSHHNNLKKTLSNDKISLEILKTHDISRIGDAEIDTKQSLALLFSFLKEKGAQEFNYYYTNAAFLLNHRKYGDVTSYFFAYYLKGEKSFFEYKKSIWQYLLSKLKCN